MLSLPNELILDASILFSFFKEDSVRRKIIEELLNGDCKIISPVFAIKELLLDKEKILKYGGIDEHTFRELLSLLTDEIDFIPEKEYKSLMSKANKLSPHGENTKDDPYFALSLSRNKISIWSDEKAFKEQSEIKIFSTEELLEILKSLGYKF